MNTTFLALWLMLMNYPRRQADELADVEIASRSA
jgi:hypothetical protein